MRRFQTSLLFLMYAPVPQKSLRSEIEHRHLFGMFSEESWSIWSRFKNLP